MDHGRRAGIQNWLCARHVVPVFIVVAILACSVAFWQMLRDQEHQHIRGTISAESGLISEHVASEITARFKTLDRMAHRWEYRGRPSRQQWMQDASLNLVDFPGFHSIQWMDHRQLVQWVAPVAESEPALALDHAAEPARLEALTSARRTGQVTVTTPVQLSNGERGFAVYRPIFLDDDSNQFDGYIVGTFSTNEIFTILLDHPIVDGYSVEISNSGESMYRITSDDKAQAEEWRFTRAIPLGGRAWQFDVWPGEEELAAQQSLLPLMALVSGIVLAMLFGLLVYLTQLARDRTNEAQTLSTELDVIVQALEQSNRELEEFAYVASHDLKAPLVSLCGMADILAEDFREELPADAHMYLDRITVNAGKMQNLLDDLLQLSRLRHTDAPFVDVDLNGVVASIAAQLHQVLEARGADVRVLGILPVIQGNPMWVSQIFLNLIDNAVHYMPAGRTPVVEISAHRREGVWLVHVRDNGEGIPDEYRDRVFGMFQRLPRGKSLNPGGSGMGLAIVARAMGMHNGSVKIESSGAEGTTFTLRFPVLGADAEMTADTAMPRRSHAAS